MVHGTEFVVEKGLPSFIRKCSSLPVIPAKAGIQNQAIGLDSRLRGNDIFMVPCEPPAHDGSLENIPCRFIKLAIYLFIVFSLLYPVVASARTAPNIPLNNWIYNYLDILDARGFIKSGILSTRPFSRAEGRRLTDEAMRTWDSLPDNKINEMQDIRLTLNMLDREFSEPSVDTVYLKYTYSDDRPDYLNTNNNGDDIKAGHNVRAGISTDLRLGDNISFYFNPEFRGREGGTEGEVIAGYGL